MVDLLRGRPGLICVVGLRRPAWPVYGGRPAARLTWT